SSWHRWCFFSCSCGWPAVPLHRQPPRGKLDFANNVQLSLTLAALSLGLWWTFDRSRSGLGLGITIAFVATLITQFLVYNGVYQYTSPDFLYIRSWLPCIFFSGGVTVGNIGLSLTIQMPSIVVSPRTNYASKGMTHKLSELNRGTPKS
uniref:Insulin-induced gene protein n=1 Tax=Zosterops lateralis melanops TaxID=1220523 RepID=A0A8D2P038_ZOSLA